MLKFTKNTTKKKLVIPNDVMERSGFEKGAPVEIRAMDDAILIMKSEMTAMELVRAVNGLQETAVELMMHLAGVCGSCEGCDDCGGRECPADPSRTETRLPEDIRKDLGIPAGAKLCTWLGAEEGTAIVGQADYRYDLTDVPAWERDLLRCLGVCFSELEELLISEDPVYDSEDQTYG